MSAPDQHLGFIGVQRGRLCSCPELVSRPKMGFICLIVTLKASLESYRSGQALTSDPFSFVRFVPRLTQSVLCPI